jgi:hypothetical protein
MLISISPDTTPVVNQNREALVGFSNINPHKAIVPGFGKIPFNFAPNKAQFNDKARFYANMSTYTLGMTPEELVVDIIRKAGGEGIDTPRPFLLPGY